MLALVVSALAAGCAQEELPQSVYDSRQAPSRQISASQSPDATANQGADASGNGNHLPTGDEGGPPPGRPDSGSSGSGQCVQALAEPLPARIAVLTSSAGSAASADRVVTIDFLYGKLWGYCARCHSTGANAFRVMGAADLASAGGEGFATKGEEALAHILGDSATPGAIDEAMPPIDPTTGSLGVGGTRRAQLYPNDPLVDVANLLSLWVKAGAPPDQFTIKAAATAPAADADGGAEGGAPVTYRMAPDVGNGMTSLGNCIPDTSIVAIEQAKSMALDVKFAQMKRSDFGEGTQADVIGLPEKLSDTDLTTFDGEALARMGVIAFVPQYPLWSDDAGKLRQVRVPRGQSIRFDKDTQEFHIPENTRFYKTFLKKIVDTDGNESWRKIETRLIVSRGDTVNGATTQIKALYGSYLWKEDESDAILVGSGHAPHDLIVSGKADTLLNDNEGFTDTVLQYETDANTHATRHYAIPSSTRCVQCHQGSPSQSFVLGFRPVQLRHRPVGQGGVIEPSGYDEMDLLGRLIDYGIVTGLTRDTIDDVLPLELSEGSRLPRNDKELTAQGYMLGNCSHCHNPRGFPSVTFPQLNDVAHLSFLPGTGDFDGIFQFPLEKFSPRITRGFRGDVHIPYITPSLMDNPSFPPTLDPNAGDTDPNGSGGIWQPKWSAYSPPSPPQFVFAPWRSLIYRNVDTPFTYTDDFAIYPHMPVNTPGYDLRAKQILGDWMVSIPAIRKRPEIDEYGFPYVENGAVLYCGGGSPASACLANVRTLADDSPQPYVEIKPGMPGYEAAFATAQQRLAAFHLGTRLGDGPPPDFTPLDFKQNRYADPVRTEDDIIDPSVDPVCTPTPPVRFEDPPLNIPTHAHWVPIDLTLSSGDWTPRRKDWNDVFTHGPQLGATSSCLGIDTDLAQLAKDNQQCVIDMLKGLTCAANPVPNGDPVTLDTVLRDFANPKKPKAMGLWRENPSCDWSQEPWKSHGPTVAEARAMTPHSHWLDGPAGADATRHVYMATPGEAVFGMICINCHGPNADSHGRLADNLATMTGGNAVVADLRDGLFGPQSSPGMNRAKVFPDDDTAARYMAWMALGGTQVTIPVSYLTIIGQTPVLGEVRPGGVSPPKSANMLSVARNLCMSALTALPYDLDKHKDYYETSSGEPLLVDNFDAELWLRLCSVHNPAPVLPYAFYGSGSAPIRDVNVGGINNSPPQEDRLTALAPSPVLLRCGFNSGGCGADASAPAASPVGDERGDVLPTLSDDNLHPWCVVAPDTSDQKSVDWLRGHCLGGSDCDAGRCSGVYPDTNCVYAPICPATPVWDDASGTAALNWAQRGAINAGLVVFLYLNSITTLVPADHYDVQPAYDRCPDLASLKK